VFCCSECVLNQCLATAAGDCCPGCYPAPVAEPDLTIRPFLSFCLTAGTPWLQFLAAAHGCCPGCYGSVAEPDLTIHAFLSFSRSAGTPWLQCLATARGCCAGPPDDPCKRTGVHISVLHISVLHISVLRISVLRISVLRISKQVVLACGFFCAGTPWRQCLAAGSGYCSGSCWLA
jgi:hypothetical protein